MLGLALLLPKNVFLCWFDTLYPKHRKTNTFARVLNTKKRQTSTDRCARNTQSLPTIINTTTNPTPTPPKTLHYLSLLSAMVALLLSSLPLSLCNFVLLFIASSVWISNYVNAKLSILMMGTPWISSHTGENIPFYSSKIFYLNAKESLIKLTFYILYIFSVCERHMEFIHARNVYYLVCLAVVMMVVTVCLQPSIQCVCVD